MGLVGKLKEKAMSAILASLVKKLAEGGFGEAPMKVYWWLVGKKTWTAMAMSTVASGLFLAAQLGKCDACWGLGMYLATASTFLAGIGVFDAAVRIQPPAKPPGIK